MKLPLFQQLAGALQRHFLTGVALECLHGRPPAFFQGLAIGQLQLCRPLPCQMGKIMGHSEFVGPFQRLRRASLPQRFRWRFVADRYADQFQ